MHQFGAFMLIHFVIISKRKKILCFYRKLIKCFRYYLLIELPFAPSVYMQNLKFHQV